MPLAHPEPVLEVFELSKTFGERVAVQSVSFSLTRGAIFGLLGPNGAGKTTTIGMIAGIVRPSGGRLRSRGEDVSPEAIRGRFGLVPQRVALYPSLSAEENLAFFGRIYGLESERIRARVDALLQMAGLTARRRDPVGEFSGGMKRRLNLACGLVHEPDVVLLDEPTVGVDPQSRERIYESLTSLAEGGTALVLTTHQLEEAEKLCHTLAIMDEGRFIAEGTVDDMLGGFEHEQTIELRLGRAANDSLASSLTSFGGQAVGPTQWVFPGDDATVLVPRLLARVTEEGSVVQELRVHRPNLGDVFLRLTGKALRD